MKKLADQWLKCNSIRAIGLVFFCASLGLPIQSQTAVAGPVNSRSELESTSASGKIIRKIDDPQTGNCWLLVRDPAHNGGPGRLISAPVSIKGIHFGETASTRLPTFERTASPVIHPGDHVILEENTAVVDARLEAVALGPAMNGTRLSVRLVLGGRVVQAIALGPRRVAFASESGTRQ